MSAEPSFERLAAAVRRGLRLPEDAPVVLVEAGELSNINYVYRVDAAGRRLYLKVIPERPKRLPVSLPRERVHSEAAGLRQFRALAGADLLVPEVLFVDGEEMAIAMSDVGEGRDVLFNVLPHHFELLVEQASALGRALGAVHGGTRGMGSVRPPREEQIIRRIVFDGLLAPGAKHAFPELWDALNAEMQGHDECLVHADLWSKNLLVAGGVPMAVVDFEGVLYADPAFDLGTLIAVALVPALDDVALLDDAMAFASELLHAWAAACGSDEWASEVLPRAFRATATFLAARAFGPFAYVLTDSGRQRIWIVARLLAGDAPREFSAFRDRVLSAAEQPCA